MRPQVTARSIRLERSDAHLAAIPLNIHLGPSRFAMFPSWATLATALFNRDFAIAFMKAGQVRWQRTPACSVCRLSQVAYRSVPTEYPEGF